MFIYQISMNNFKFGKSIDIRRPRLDGLLCILRIKLKLPLDFLLSAEPLENGLLQMLHIKFPKVVLSDGDIVEYNSWDSS
ncbi:hypothetical protein DERP_007559 [Dermatophagoides pteronyssinus]|uniref:Uncharacterized protein n=1 Tax=Dermatophagoides pteronyssinus TaxID=6956 RepID=A0ABQ8JK34_DERPT|nr:hypothetical protein DERP_007559 [Dermatophagoides pteronyssinus]